MKLKLFLFVFSLFLFSLSMSAQVKFVAQAEYDEIDKIKEKIENLSRIETNISNDYEEGKLVKTEKLVQEYESSKRNKWTFYETVGDSTKKTLEIIYFDNREFRRENEGVWKEIKRDSEGGIGGGMGLRVKELTNLKQYAIGTMTYENKPARMFSFFRVYDYGKYLNFYNSLILVNADNLIVKETGTISDMFPNNVVKTDETTYLYKPKDLKIEVPIK